MGIRRKEDPWNSIASGALTGAVLAARGTMYFSVANEITPKSNTLLTQDMSQ